MDKWDPILLSNHLYLISLRNEGEYVGIFRKSVKARDKSNSNHYFYSLASTSSTSYAGTSVNHGGYNILTAQELIIQELPMYISFPYKTILFEHILTSGRVPTCIQIACSSSLLGPPQIWHRWSLPDGYDGLSGFDPKIKHPAEKGKRYNSPY